jgi:hypothetical protein
MFALYLISRVLGNKIIVAFLPATIIESLSIIYEGFTSNLGHSQGGWFADTNYSLATLFVLIGFLIYQGKYKWQLGTLTLIALFFTGNTAVIFLITVYIISLIIKHDWNWKKIAMTTCLLISIISFYTIFGYTQQLWNRTYITITHLSPSPDNIHVILPTGKESDNPLWLRVDVIGRAMQDIQPLGHGIQITSNNQSTIHNVPLIIIDQIGIIGALAWCIATVYLLTHSKQKYLWIMFIALGIFDHETWDNAAPYWWVLAGTSMVTNIKNDYIFKEKS